MLVKNLKTLNNKFRILNQLTTYLKSSLIYFKSENKKNHINVNAFKLNIIPKNINTNFLPIKAVFGSSFTLIKSSNYFGKDSID